MESKIKTVILAMAIYISQVGALWGLLEGYTYFKGDTLKTVLGAYWLLLYIFPLITTAVYIKFFEGNEKKEFGGTGGDAEVIGDGEARGGKGGNSGMFGPGGKGGNARVIGTGKAKGGAGGHG